MLHQAKTLYCSGEGLLYNLRLENIEKGKDVIILDRTN